MGVWIPGLKVARRLGVVLALVCAASAMAQSGPNAAPAASDPLQAIGEALKLRATTRDPADFVRNSRKPDGELQYVPLGAANAEPARRVLTPDEIRAAERDLDGVRAKHDAMAGRKTAAAPAKSVAPGPAGPAKPKTRNCLITCVVSPNVASEPASAAAR